MSRSRTITKKPKNNGEGCGALTETRKCGSSPCPVDCKVEKWKQWSKCSKPCGGGRQARERKVVQQSLYGGKLCPHLTDQRTCNTIKCPVHCQVYAWAEWGRCSQSCGGGKQTRIRAVAIPARWGGRQCKKLKQTQNCNKHDCPVPCKVSSWSAWSKCSKSCGGGSQSHQRKITQKPKFKGKKCPALKVDRKCNEAPCPVHCKMEKWTPWAKCSKSCGGGTTTRTRQIQQKPKHGGKGCPVKTQKRACQTQPCPIDCKVFQWNAYHSCSRPCGGGLKIRTRMVKMQPKHAGKPCPSLTNQTVCNELPCPLDCVVSKWGKPGECSKVCGGGLALMNRTVTTKPQHDGTKCPALSKSISCNMQKCPVHCKMSGWLPWSKCTKKCGGGLQGRQRVIRVASKHGGLPCGDTKTSRACNTKPCAVHCKMAKWSNWAKCSKSCGTGSQKRARKIAKPPKHGGKSCAVAEERRNCNSKPCPVPCKLKKWGGWEKCSVQCGGGLQSRARLIAVEPRYNGTKCGRLVEQQKCNNKPCPIDCEVTDWGVIGKCSKKCGGGKANQRRTITTQSAHGGRKCPKLARTQSCNLQPCPVACVVSKWSKSSACTKHCGGGTKYQTRQVRVPARYGGKACPTLKLVLPCSTNSCPIDCVHSKFGAWGKCSKTCGGGAQKRLRTVKTQEKYGGKRCGKLVQHRSCNKTPCPQHCKVGPWGGFDKCSQACGGGTQRRERRVKTPAQVGGKSCGRLSETRKCNILPCAIKCENLFGQIAPWRSCSQQFIRDMSASQAKCESKKKQDFILTHADGNGRCTPKPQLSSVDLGSGASKPITLQKASNAAKGSKSILQATLFLSCPVSIQSKLNPKELQKAAPYAVCVKYEQKICSEIGAPGVACTMMHRTQCVEACVHARFCKISSGGRIVKQNHGWRAGKSEACCFRDCKLPEWYTDDGTLAEPPYWCHQSALQIGK